MNNSEHVTKQRTIPEVLSQMEQPSIQLARRFRSTVNERSVRRRDIGRRRPNAPCP